MLVRATAKELASTSILEEALKELQPAKMMESLEFETKKPAPLSAFSSCQAGSSKNKRTISNGDNRDN